jgi:Tfp pilus assembly protein PilN
VSEINLLPGTTPRRAARKGLRLGGGKRRAGTPRASRTPANRSVLLVVLLWAAGLGAIGYLYVTSTDRLETLHTEYEAAQRDSARYALLRAQGDSLAAREAIIAQKMQLIQEIDAGRYTWAHILDEVSRALPSYVWLVHVGDVNAATPGVPRLRIDGRAGNYYAIGEFIEDLEASPFLTGVKLLSSARTTVTDRAVLQFNLEMDYATPPPDAIQTVPLFAATPPQEN